MRRFLTLLLVSALAALPLACKPQPEGAIKVAVIGGEPRLRDPGQGPLSPAEAVLAQNVAQGLVRLDASGNIVAGLAERWNVSDDGLSYIFRIASAEWPDGGRITAQQVARLFKRQLTARSRNPLKDTLGAVDDVVAMTDRVIEIRLIAPRPNLLPLLAQPEFTIVRGSEGAGPFAFSPLGEGQVRLRRAITPDDDGAGRREEVLLAGNSAAAAVNDFAAGKSDLVLGGSFGDLPLAQHSKLPRGSLRFDPASGLFGLVPTRSGGPLDKPEARRLLSQALDRDNFVSSIAVPGLAPRATVLEAGLDGVSNPVAPAWTATPLAQRRPALVAQARRLFGTAKPIVRIALPDAPGAAILFDELQRDWGALGLAVERVASSASADFRLVDSVAPSPSAAWFLRQFRCGLVAVCDSQVDQLLDAARTTLVPAQRYALLGQAGGRIDDDQLFIPIAAPVRWSLVSNRIQGFAGNRYARHTLTDLEQRPGSGD